ncbi:pyridoxal-phosphate dependent enzyme [Sphingomonas sp. CCH18-H6]|uniref:pyridoxal-phosphate dependent enzyme n=1 Tax=Sphingomonas sp. CCH18-H6 TaxID=1768787 RepID=UPI00082BBFAE|nr:pyridoxal-phosphate dependent enzyme [Sphingomonas sp. CCH18-H6]
MATAREDLTAALACHPRTDLRARSTPLLPAPALSRELGVECLVKRDDLIPLPGGGNKARKLEYLTALALGERATTLVTTGAIQSNHARLTAAAAAVSGLRCVVALIDMVDSRSPTYKSSGNVLLEHLLGAEIRWFKREIQSSEALDIVCRELAAAGERPFAIPLGGSNGVGALGFVKAALELLDDAAKSGIRVAEIHVASSSGGTAAGLLLGLTLTNAPIRLHVHSVMLPAAEAEAQVRRIASEASRLLGHELSAESFDVDVSDSGLGPGYGLTTEAAMVELRQRARQDALLLDPVYTSKVLVGLRESLASGRRPDGAVVFWHTGGTPALYAYGSSGR